MIIRGSCYIHIHQFQIVNVSDSIVCNFIITCRECVDDWVEICSCMCIGCELMLFNCGTVYILPVPTTTYTCVNLYFIFPSVLFCMLVCCERKHVFDAMCDVILMLRIHS